MAVDYTGGKKVVADGYVASPAQTIVPTEFTPPQVVEAVTVGEVFLALLNAQSSNRDLGHWKEGNEFTQRVAELKSIAIRIAAEYGK